MSLIFGALYFGKPTEAFICLLHTSLNGSDTTEMEQSCWLIFVNHQRFVEVVTCLIRFVQLQVTQTDFACNKCGLLFIKYPLEYLNRLADAVRASFKPKSNCISIAIPLAIRPSFHE